MAFANAVLNNQVGDLLAEQFAASKGITISAVDLATATSDFEATLDGEISAAVQQASTVGHHLVLPGRQRGQHHRARPCWPPCPASSRTAQVRNQAVDEKLLARGPTCPMPPWPRTTTPTWPSSPRPCVSVIATDTQAHADQLVAQINAGATFASVAKANSLDTQTAANGGALGCNYTRPRWSRPCRCSR